MKLPGIGRITQTFLVAKARHGVLECIQAVVCRGKEVVEKGARRRVAIDQG
jgi:hypothetical protein